jgi:hypothetical protein
MSAIPRSGSTAPVLVVPAVATTAIAGIPAWRSRSMAAASASVRIRNAPSTGISRRFARPTPSSASAFRHGHVNLGRGIHRTRPGAVLVRRYLGLACHRQAHQVRRRPAAGQAAGEAFAADGFSDPAHDRALDGHCGRRRPPGGHILVQHRRIQITDRRNGLTRTQHVGEEPRVPRGAGNNRPVSTATASSFLNCPGVRCGKGVVVSVAGTGCRCSRVVGWSRRAGTVRLG